MFTGIIKNKQVKDAEKNCIEIGKKFIVLAERDGGKYSVNYAVFDNVKGESEMHENADDVYYVVEGKAMLKLGGEIVEKQEKGPGEFIGSDLKNAKVSTIEKGDIVSIPRKTPHMVDGSKTKVKYAVIKVY